jgi:transcriptional regulator GlxA family with amidase domain
MFVQALRAHLASGHAPFSGWLGALTDPQIAAALGLMHGAVAQRWSVASLAEAVGMSRSSFAQRFSAKVGTTPHDYLVHLRMRMAAESLRTRGRRVSSVAFELGYQSESAFSKAYKRVMGALPSERSSASPARLMGADGA